MPYWDFAEGLRLNLEKKKNREFYAIVEQSYSFITLKIADQKHQIIATIEYQIQYRDSLVFYDFYCSNDTLIDSLKYKAQKLTGTFKWQENPSAKFSCKKEILDYLHTADEIAKIGNDINAHPSAIMGK